MLSLPEDTATGVQRKREAKTKKVGRTGKSDDVDDRAEAYFRAENNSSN